MIFHYVISMLYICLCFKCTLSSCEFKEGLYRIWCGVNRLGDSGMHTLGDN